MSASPSSPSRAVERLRLSPSADATWTGPSGSTFIVVPTPSVVVIVMRGRVDSPAGPVIYRVAGEALRRSEADVFFDIADMVGYQSDVRAQATDVILHNSGRVKSVHAIATSSLVKMGVAVANIALGGKITQHADVLSFDTALEQAIAHGRRS